MIEALVPYIPAIVGGLLALLTLGFAWVKGKGWIKEGFLTELERDVKAVVSEVSDSYVEAYNRAAEDGVVTEEEKKEARQLVIDRLIEVGKSKGKDYAKTWLVPIIVDLVEKFVRNRRVEDAEVAVAVAHAKEQEAKAEKARTEAKLKS
jgi:hypothetical protein